MEPPDAQACYTEKLVRLPNLSIYYEPAVAEPVSITREELGLRAGATAFWSGQSLFKYLPQYDDVFVRIAQAVGDCQFVFLRHFGAPRVTQLVRERLERAFSAAGMSAALMPRVFPRLCARAAFTTKCSRKLRRSTRT